MLAYGDARRLLQYFAAPRRLPIEVARIVRPQPGEPESALAEVLSPEALAREGVRGIILVSHPADPVPAHLLLRCRLEGFEVLDSASFLEQEAFRIDVDAADFSWGLSGRGFRTSRMAEVRRRLFDILLAGLLMLLTLPLTLLVAILIKFDSAGPILYQQERVGLRGRVFTLFKFRSMYEDAEASGKPVWASVGDTRVTRVGRFLRFTRIDELPQLLNVLYGEMSFIGPRPERPYFVERLSEAIPLYSSRHYVKPGITGWAQVNAPYGASTDDAFEKLCFDLYYIKHRGIFLDLVILLRTLRVVASGQGAR